MAATLQINLQFPYGLAFAGLEDGRFRLFSSDGALVSGLPAAVITEIEAGDGVIYNVVQSGIPRTYIPGEAIFDFSDGDPIDATTKTAAQLTILLQLAMANLPPAGTMGFNHQFDHEFVFAERDDARFRVFSSDGTLLTLASVSKTITEVEAADSSLYNVVVAGLPTSYIPGFGLFDFEDDQDIRAILLDSVDLTDLIRDAATVIRDGFPTPDEIIEVLEAMGLTPPPIILIYRELLSVISYVERYLQRTFGSVSGSRIYYPESPSSKYIFFDEAVQLVTAVKLLDVDGEAVHTYLATDYRLHPPGAAGRKTHMEWCSRSSLIRFGFSGCEAAIEVTGTYGEALPADVYQAIIKLTVIALAYLLIEAGREGGLGVTRWDQDDMSESYGKSSALEGWKEEADRILKMRKKVSLI